MSAEKKAIAIGADHAGFQMKSALIDWLKAKGWQVLDLGAYSEESVDYPDYSKKVTSSMADKKADLGILICGSGIGMSIAANREKNIRAALIHNKELATLARTHNNANIAVLAARFIDIDTAKEVLEAFISEDFEGGRHKRRVDKLK